MIPDWPPNVTILSQHSSKSHLYPSSPYWPKTQLNKNHKKGEGVNWENLIGLNCLGFYTYIHTEISIDQTNTRFAQAPLELCTIHTMCTTSQSIPCVQHHNPYHVYNITIHTMCTTSQSIPCVQRHNPYHVYNITIHAMCTTSQSIPCVQHHNPCHVYNITIHAMCTTLQSIPCVQHYNPYHVYNITIHTMCTTSQSIPCVQHYNPYHVYNITIHTRCTTLQAFLFIHAIHTMCTTLQAFLFIHTMWLTPPLLAVVTYLLNLQLGLAALIPCLILMIQVPVQLGLGKIYAKLRFVMTNMIVHNWTDNKHIHMYVHTVRREVLAMAGMSM